MATTYLKVNAEWLTNCASNDKLLIMPQLSIIVSEIEAAERLEELIGLALAGQNVMVEAANGQRIMLEPVSDHEAD